MRVEFNTLEEFIKEVIAEAENIHRRIVRFRIDRTPLQREAISFGVGYWATALVDSEDGQYVIELGYQTGVDFDEGGDSDLSASEAANSAMEKILAACEQNGLTMRPGKIEVI